MLAAERIVAQLEQSHHYETRTTQFGLTLLTFALAALAVDDLVRARQWIDRVPDAAFGDARRLCALRAALVAMIAGRDDPERFVTAVGASLAALRTASFGGIAGIIEALPSPFAAIDGTVVTIGRFLAERELATQFALAAESGNVPAFTARLDGAHHSLRGGVGLDARLASWADERKTCEREAVAHDKVRRALAAYRWPAASAIVLIDDVDAAMAVLLDDLQISSPLMAEHSRAVSAWCSRLGRALALSEADILFVTRCGLIHDVGKVWTPADILEAPRALTPHEWAIMRAHTTDGSSIVSRVPVLTPFAPIVRGHHERLDGKGYPDGLAAAAIPLASRIVAVADSFNAMIGRRPYRTAMAPTEALRELERHCGTQFDADIVAAMVKVVLGRPS